MQSISVLKKFINSIKFLNFILLLYQSINYNNNDIKLEIKKKRVKFFNNHQEN